MRSILSIVLSSMIFFSCDQPKTSEQKLTVPVTEAKNPALDFIYGLWSLDIDNNLNNAGYYFMNDGTFHIVASEVNGNWELSGMDSILLTYASINSKPEKIALHIDTLLVERMVLSGNSGTSVFRKVPFGKNTEGTVLSGFMGTLAPGIEKEYTFNLPATKEIKIELVTDEPGITFRFFDGEKEITSTSLRSWEGIIIRGGSYRVLLSRSTKGALSDEATDFNLKIIGY